MTVYKPIARIHNWNDVIESKAMNTADLLRTQSIDSTFILFILSIDSCLIEQFLFQFHSLNSLKILLSTMWLLWNIYIKIVIIL